MRYRLRTLLILMAVGPLLFIGGCAEKGPPNVIPSPETAALESGEQFELLSLEPLDGQVDDEDGFHGWKVLGRTTLDQQTRLNLVAALKKGVAEIGGAASCFRPRHGIRVKHDDKVFDFVICFECMQVETYADSSEGGGFLVSRSPQPAFDEALRRASIPLPKAKPKP